AWLLEHWDADPPLPPDCSIEAAQARATIDSFRAVFLRVRADPRLRSRLHWNNGTLAATSPTAPEVLRATIDWPDTYWFAAPVRGGFGFFLGEVLINAVRHGRPGALITLTITLDRVRRELLFTVENDETAGTIKTLETVETVETVERTPESYGGRRLLERMAHLCDWRDLRFERQGHRFRVFWRVPVSERGDPTLAD
ncbi:MAG: hypothetical protein M3O15_04520, partial [Acidobacteriota bacterium]|nr:hypothetical protein [Acidobacteriota bacterium]